MDEQDELAARFDGARGHLRGVAFRMLGSLDEADDAVQEAWLRAGRAGAGGVVNVTGWLTTIVGRICLDMLRARRRRAEEPAGLDAAAAHPAASMAASAGEGARPAGPAHAAGTERGPEDEAILVESVGLAMLVVLDTLGPAERVAFVLHDLFGVPFEEIAPIVERSPAAAKKLASRARGRIRGTPAVPAADLARQRTVVAAFLAASRAGDLDALLAVLAPDAVRRADPAALPPGAPAELRGARRIAEETRGSTARARAAALALVDGMAGVVVAPRGHLRGVLQVTVEDGRITAYTVITDPARLRGLELAVLPPA